MPANPLFQAFLSILAGIVVALVTVELQNHRERQRWVRENVYRPLSEELDQVQSGEIPQESVWDDFDYYQKSRIDSELRQMLDDYTDDIEQIKELKNQVISQEFIEILPEDMGELQGGEAVFVSGGGGYIEINKWLEKFSPAIQDATGPTELRENLYNLSESNNWGHERRFRYWDEEYSSWPEALWDAIHIEDITEGLQDISQKRGSLYEKAEKIGSKIQSHMDESLIRSFWRRIDS